MAPSHKNTVYSVRLLLKGVTSLVSMALLASCSLWSGTSAKPVPADLGANVPILGVRQVWAAQVGRLGNFPLAVRSAGTTVTVASEDGVVAAIDVRTGQDLWRTKLAEPLSAGVGGDGRATAVVTRSNALIVLEAGRERWRRTLTAQVFTPL